MFELGCGGSRFLARGAHLGWDVGGIDFNITGIDLIRGHLAESGADPSNVVCDDVFTFDCTRFARTYDILASFGFLEHFRNPAAILSRWKCVLNESGIIVSAIPNLFSINARLLEKYDIDLWRQHVPYSPEEMDEYHSEAGLVPIRRARYFGLYDLHMLVPWGKIEKQIARPLAFRMLKLTASYVVAPPLRLISKSESRLLSPLVVGVYAAGHS